MPSRTIRLGALLVCAVAVAPPATAAAWRQRSVVPPELVSQTPAGIAGNGVSGLYGLAISGDGRSVAFSSMATDLVPEDQDASPDIYVRHVRRGTTMLASVTAAGEKGDAISTRPSLSFDGDRVAFLSAATNLDPVDGESRVDAYVKDLDTGELARMSKSSTGERANGPTSAVALSANGRVVAFVSSATNLDPRDSDDLPDVYVVNRRGEVTLVSIAPDGSKPQTGRLGASDVSLSWNGRWVAFSTDAALDPADTNDRSDVYVKDRWTGDLVLASTTADGAVGDAPSTHPVLTGDGDAVVFSSFADNLDGADRQPDSDVYLKDLSTGALSLVSTNWAGEKGDDSSSTPAISGDGRQVAFSSYATNLGRGPRAGRELDVYVKDLISGRIVDASVLAPEEPADIVSLYPALPYFGARVAFASNATRFTPADTNNIADVYLARLRRARR